MKKKTIICPHCNKEIIINITPKGCVEIDTSFFDDNYEKVNKLLADRGIEFGAKVGDRKNG